jgi:hypothetical protein
LNERTGVREILNVKERGKKGKINDNGTDK